MSSPADFTYDGGGHRSEMADIFLRRRQALMAELRLQMDEIDSSFDEPNSSSMPETVSVYPLANSGLIRLPGEEATHIRFIDAIALLRAKQIARVWANSNPRTQEEFESFPLDAGYPSLASFAAAHGYRARIPVDVTWDELKGLVAAELGIERDGD